MYERKLRSRKKKKRKSRKGLWLLVCASGLLGVLVPVVGRVVEKPKAIVGNAAGEVVEAMLVPGVISVSRDIPLLKEPKIVREVPLIAIDPGHGGEDEGGSAQTLLEKDINLNIAKQVEEKLVALGYQVLMIREDDSFLTKEERVDKANALQTDIYVSIHQNTYETPDVSGIETLYDGVSGTRDSKRLAELVHRETIRASEASEREVQDDAGLYVTGNTDMPACLIETGFLTNTQESERLATGEYQEQLASGITRGIDYYFRPKTMYLTFDDGPSEENTNAVLDVLKERNIKATFFVVGENVRRHPNTTKRIVEEGHTIGIHCDSHDYKTLYESVDSYIQDFEKAYDAVLQTTGVEVKLFRFPGGSINSYNAGIYPDIIKEMTNRGFAYYDWNASLEDSLSKAEPEALIASAKETTMGRSKVVMLAHDIVHSTALCLDELIEQFPEYKMEPLTPEVEPVHFNP